MGDRLLLRARIIALLATIAELAIVMPAILLELWLWIAVVIATVLAHVLIVARTRGLEGRRGPAFRRAMLWAPALTSALSLPLSLAVGVGARSLDPLLSTAIASAVLATPPAAIGYAAIERSLPENLREPDERRFVWRPTPKQTRELLLAWPPITLALFWLLTGLGTEAECVVDGSCSSGVPVRFARFGSRGGSSMRWDRLALDLGLFASLLPAAFMAATSRVRGVFAAYVLLVCAWIGVALLDNWGGLAGLEMWTQVRLLELGR